MGGGSVVGSLKIGVSLPDTSILWLLLVVAFLKIGVSFPDTPIL
jgi:hypothetical protein